MALDLESSMASAVVPFSPITMRRSPSIGPIRSLLNISASGAIIGCFFSKDLSLRESIVTVGETKPSSLEGKAS